MTDPMHQVLGLAMRQALAYRTGVPDAPHRPTVGYRDALARFAGPLPEQGEDGEAVISDLVARAGPGLHAHTGPRFFGWVIGHSHPVGVAADWLAAAWGQNTGNHQAAPAAAAAEAVAADWLLALMDLPRESSVGFVTGGTMANFVGLAAARAAVLRQAGWDIGADGLAGAPPISILIGEDAHATVFSALRYLGFGHRRVVQVATDDQGRMRPDALEAALGAARAPSSVILQAGQINTGAFDPLAELVPLARRAGSWVHIDGAFGLWARATPALRHLAAGAEAADSWAVDGHKWLQVPYDSGYAIVRDRSAHEAAMGISASYLPATDAAERDPSHLVPELSRRARGFATWAMIRHLGRTGIADMVERHCRLARRFAERLGAEPGIEVVNDVVLNQVAVRFGSDRAPEEADDLTNRTIRALQADGTCFAGGATWKGRQILRLSVMSGSTREADVDRSADAILGAWHGVASR